MPSVLLTESLAVELGAQEPWPQDVKLFQPYEVEQILLPDNANCLAVQAFLKMCGLDFEVEPRSNAEYMSPSGRVPFIKCGAFVVAELDPIISFVNNKGISLSEQLDSSHKADMRAYMSLVNTVLANAELYVTWCDKATLQEVTKPRFGSVLPWPLNHVIAWQKRGQVVKKLGVLGWANKSIDEVYQEVENCCSALSERLANRPFFFGDSPTELDALLYGHLFAILTAPLPVPANKVASTVRKHKDLIDFVKQIDQKFFNRSTSVSQENMPTAEEPPPSQQAVEENKEADEEKFEQVDLEEENVEQQSPDENGQASNVEQQSPDENDNQIASEEPPTSIGDGEERTGGNEQEITDGNGEQGIYEGNEQAVADADGQKTPMGGEQSAPDEQTINRVQSSEEIDEGSFGAAHEVLSTGSQNVIGYLL